MNVWLMGTNEVTADFLALVAGRMPISGVIGLTDREANDNLSGLVPMQEQADRHGLPFVGVESYALNHVKDRAALEALDIDLLLVMGWQRLIPAWLIEHCGIGAVGSHGSPNGISEGRGRSPQNWAIILGASAFNISIFFLDPGIDSGDVIDTRAFPIQPHDDIASSYAKVAFLTAEMIVNAWNGGALAERRANPQPVGGLYLPQRLPGDGGIDWTRSAHDICAFVRALTKPYPGAFSALEGGNVSIWRAREFDLVQDGENVRPGEVVMTMTNGRFVVAAGFGWVMVDEYTFQDKLPAFGDCFASVSFTDQMKTIINRHLEKYPDLTLSKDILDTVGD